MSVSTPRTKSEFYQRYAAGEFGNRPRCWSTLEALQAAGFHGRVTVRDLTPGGRCLYNVGVDDLRADVAGCRFNESMPDSLLTIQGNVWLAEDGLRLEYSREPNVGHRYAVGQLLREARHLEALGLLTAFLDPSSLDDLRELLASYPDAIVEFSTYRVPVGVLHRNTVFWEVRGY